VDGVDGRSRRRSGTRGSVVTYTRRQRRGEVAGNRSTRWRKRGERGDRFSRRTTARHTYPGRRLGRRRRGALGHARSEAERRWLRTRAFGAVCEARQGEASGQAVRAACFGRGDGVSDSGAVGWCLYGAGAWRHTETAC
jgi:hypothetical protein